MTSVGIAVGHHEPRVRKHLVQRIEPQHMRRRLQPPWPRRFAPAQQLHHPPLVGVGRRQVGLFHQPRRVRRNLRKRLEDMGFEVQRHQLQTLHRSVRCRSAHAPASRPCCARPWESADPGPSPSTAAGTAATIPSGADIGSPGPARAAPTTPSNRCAVAPIRSAAAESRRRRSPGGGDTSPRPAAAATAR